MLDAGRATVRQRVGAAGFGSAFRRGSDMPIGVAVDYAHRQTPVKQATAVTARPATVLSRRELEVARWVG